MDERPNNLPRLAVILLWYPLFTQPFIFRDVEGLKKRLGAEVYTLYGLNQRFCSQEMIDAGRGTARLGCRALPRILFSAVKFCLRHPRRFAELFSDAVVRRWPSLEVLGENLWAFLCGVHLTPILKQHGIQVTYGPWPRGTTTACRTIWKLAGIPYVTCVRANNLLPADADLADKMRDAGLVRTNNHADGRRILALTPGIKVEVIYNCLTLHVDRQAPVPMKRPVRLLAVGRFDVTKGFDVLLRACGLMRDRGVDFRLTIAGGGGKMMGLGGQASPMHKLCEDLHLTDIVDFPGLISHDKLPDLLCASDIFAAPCVVAPDGQCDGIPNTLIEAMSFGLPVVSTDVNAIPEIVRDRDTGRLVPQRDHKALADAIEDLINDPETARTYGRNAAALCRDLFSLDKNAALLADLFIREFGSKA